jgi:O-antigen/teichoic acid export membrane protein
MSLKSLGKESLIYGFGHVMARMVTFLLLPLYTHYFTPDQYGVISLSYAFTGFALIIYRYGMDTALMKYAVQEIGLEREKHITAVLISQLITSLIFSLLLYSLRKHIAPYAIGLDRPDWITFLSIILFLDSLWNLPLLILRSENKAIPFISFSFFNVLSTMLLNIYFVVRMEYGVEGVFLSNIISSLIMLLFCLPIIFKNLSITKFEFKILKKILHFGFPFLPAGFFTMIMELSDRYLVGSMMGIEDVGLYSAGKKLGMLGLTVVMGFNMGWTPYFLKRGQSVGAKREFSNIATLFIGGLGFTCLLMILWLPEIMRFSFFGKSLIGKEFWGCEKIVNSILLGYFFFGCYLIQLPGVYIKEITKWIPLFRIVGALSVIIVSILLIPIFGSLGAAYSIVLAFFFMSLSINIKLKNIYPISYNWKGFFFPLTFLIIVQFVEMGHFLRLLLSFIFPIAWYLFVLDKDQKVELKRVIK